jgi:phosphoglycolate phosphatase
MNAGAAARFGHVRAVLFDLDGTLIDSAPDLGAAADQMRTDRGLPSLPLENYRPMAGSGARGMLEVAFGVAPEHHEFEALKDEFFVNYTRCMTQRTRPFDGAGALVANLSRRGLVWGVVTNKAARFSEPLTRAMGMFVTAAVVVSGDTTPHTKPHPAPLFEAARRIGMEPASCMYVGDDHRDILAGRAAGMATVAACYGYLGRTADPRQWGADAAIKSPLDLLQLLDKA